MEYIGLQVHIDFPLPFTIYDAKPKISPILPDRPPPSPITSPTLPHSLLSPPAGGDPAPSPSPDCLPIVYPAPPSPSPSPSSSRGCSFQSSACTFHLSPHSRYDIELYTLFSVLFYTVLFVFRWV